MVEKAVDFPVAHIESRILLIRGQKVMIDRDLSELYGVETKQLKRAVRRNLDRFPSDFMFEMTREEYNSLRSQFGTLKRGTHSKYLPMAFTEQGVAMLSSVLNSERAIEVNIAIIRVFVKLRETTAAHRELKRKLEQIEDHLRGHDEDPICFRSLTAENFRGTSRLKCRWPVESFIANGHPIEVREEK